MREEKENSLAKASTLKQRKAIAEVRAAVSALTSLVGKEPLSRRQRAVGSPLLDRRCTFVCCMLQAARCLVACGMLRLHPRGAGTAGRGEVERGGVDGEHCRADRRHGPNKGRGTVCCGTFVAFRAPAVLLADASRYMYLDVSRCATARACDE
jgi:hypothetical protein